MCLPELECLQQVHVWCLIWVLKSCLMFFGDGDWSEGWCHIRKHAVWIAHLVKLNVADFLQNFVFGKLSLEWGFLGNYIYRGCLIKKFPNVLLNNNAKMVNPTVKPQAKCQNYFSIALKWGIVHLCILNIHSGTMNFRKISLF